VSQSDGKRRAVKMGCGASAAAQNRVRPKIMQTVLVHSRRASSGSVEKSPRMSVGRRTSMGEEVPEPSPTSIKWRLRRMVMAARLGGFFSRKESPPPQPTRCPSSTANRVEAWLQGVEQARRERQNRAEVVEVVEIKEQHWTLTPVSTPKSMTSFGTHTSYGDDDELLPVPNSPDGTESGIASPNQPPRRLRDARQVTRLQYILRERELRIERRRYGRQSANGEDHVGPLHSPENSPRANHHPFSSPRYTGNPLSPPEVPTTAVSAIADVSDFPTTESIRVQSASYEVLDVKEDELSNTSIRAFSHYSHSVRTNQTISSRSSDEEIVRGSSRGQGLILIPHPPSQIYDRPYDRPRTGESGRSSGSTQRARMAALDVRLPSGGCLVTLPRVSDTTSNMDSGQTKDSDSILWLESYRSDGSLRQSLSSMSSRQSQKHVHVHAQSGRKSRHSF